MGLLSGAFINLCTFPGIFVHQIFLNLACRYYKLEHAFSLFNFTSFLSSNLVMIGETDYATYGKRLERVANVGSAFICCLLGAINEFTLKGSVIEGIVVWLAVSIGIHSFPFKNSTGGRFMSFVWFDALYGMMLYFLGKFPLAAVITLFPSLGIHGTKLF